MFAAVDEFMVFTAAYVSAAAFAFVFALLIVHGREIDTLKRLNFRIWKELQEIKGNGPPPMAEVCASDASDIDGYCSECSASCNASCRCWCHGMGGRS